MREKEEERRGVLEGSGKGVGKRGGEVVRRMGWWRGVEWKSGERMEGSDAWLWGRNQTWEVSMRSSPTILSVDQCTLQSMLIPSMRLLEAFWENETHRLRDSTLHTPLVICGLTGNGLSGTLFVWNGEGVGGWLTECSVVHEHQGDLLGREETGDGD